MNRLLKNSFIMIFGNIISKFISMIIKIVQGRNISSSLIGKYMMINPIFLLAITLSTFGFTSCISKLINTKKDSVYLTFPISIIINFILIFFLFLSTPLICKIFNNQSLKWGIYAIILTIPFISLSAILKGYYFGKERFIPFIISIILSEIVRLLLTIYIVKTYDESSLLFHLYFINVFSELTSIIIMYIFLPKKIILKKEYFSFIHFKNILSISLPVTFSRLVGTIGYFLEPLIINYFLSVNYSHKYIVNEYGLISGFIMPLVLIPSFFSSAISSILLPEIAKSKSKKEIYKKTKESIILSLVLSIPFVIIFFFFPKKILYTIYHIKKGHNYLKALSLITIFHYIESPLISTLHGVNLSNKAFQGTFIGTLLEIISLIILCQINIGMYSLIIGEFVSIFSTVFYDYICLKKYLIRKN